MLSGTVTFFKSTIAQALGYKAEKSYFTKSYDSAFALTYAKHKPQEILLFLLDTYHKQNKEDPKAKYLSIAQKFFNILYLIPDDHFPQALNKLTEETYVEDIKFCETLAAFYSLYPNYFALLNNAQIKANIHLHKFEDSIYETIILKKANHMISKSGFVSGADLPLILLTGIQEKLIENAFLDFESNIIDKYSQRKTLKLLAPYASDQQIENKILPWILDISAQEEIDNLDEVYELINILIAKASLETVKTIILPRLEMNINKNRRVAFRIADSLSLIAKRLSKEEVETLILPLLVEHFHTHMVTSKSFYKLAANIFEKLPAQAFQQHIYPHLLERVKEQYAQPEDYPFYPMHFNDVKKLSFLFYYKLNIFLSSHPEIFQAEQSSGVKLEDIKAEIRLQYKTALQALQLPADDSALAQMIKSASTYEGESALTQKITALGQLVPALEEKDLMEEVIPLLIKYLDIQESADIRKEILKILATLADLTILSVENKKKVFQLLPKYENDRTPGFAACIEAMIPYIKYVKDDQETLLRYLTIFDKNDLHFSHYYETDKLHLKIIAEIINNLPSERIPEKIVEKILKIKFDSYGIAKEAYILLEILMLKINQTEMKRDFLPKLIEQLSYSFSDLTTIILKLLPKLNYDERVYWLTNLFVKNMQDSMSIYITLITALYNLNKKELAADNEMDISIDEVDSKEEMKEEPEAQVIRRRFG